MRIRLIKNVPGHRPEQGLLTGREFEVTATSKSLLWVRTDKGIVTWVTRDCYEVIDEDSAD